MKNRLLQAMKSLPMLAEDKEKFVNEIAKNSSSGIKECYYKVVSIEPLLGLMESTIPSCIILNSIIINGYLIKDAFMKQSSNVNYLNLKNLTDNASAFSTLYQSCNIMELSAYNDSIKISFLPEGDIKEKAFVYGVQDYEDKIGRDLTEEELIEVRNNFNNIFIEFYKGIVPITKEEFDSLITNN